MTQSESNPWAEGTNEDAYALDRAHVFHSWSAQGALQPRVFASGLGSRVWDFDGNQMLDFSSQLVNTNIGHQHPRVVEAIQQQAAVQATLAPQHASLIRGRAPQLPRPETLDAGRTSTHTATCTSSVPTCIGRPSGRVHSRRRAPGRWST